MRWFTASAVETGAAVTAELGNDRRGVGLAGAGAGETSVLSGVTPARTGFGADTSSAAAAAAAATTVEDEPGEAEAEEEEESGGVALSLIHAAERTSGGVKLSGN